jgi:sulfate permease, SulP family
MGDIPSGFPSLFAPSLTYLTFDVVSGALAISVIILIQGAGVSQSVPNYDGSPRRMSRDFIAQVPLIWLRVCCAACL